MQLKAFDPSDLDKGVAPPRLAYLSETVGAFALDANQGHAMFVWYHSDGGVDVHSHAMTYAGAVSFGSGRFFAYAPEPVDEDDHSHALILFSEGRVGHDEAHRLFYLAHDHLHLWAWDARCFPLHEA